MRIFMTRRFDRIRNQESIEIDFLVKAVQNVEMNARLGQWDDLGGDVYKFRLGRKGQGSSGGYRVIIALKRLEKCFLIDVYAKKDKDNFSSMELKAYKEQAKELLNLSDDELEQKLNLLVYKEIANV